MIILSENMGLFFIANLIIIVSNMINSIYKIFFEKSRDIKYVIFLYLVEFTLFLSIFNKSNDIINIYKYTIYIYAIFKLFYIHKNRSKLKLKNLNYIILESINIFSFICAIFNISMYLILNIVGNLLIIKFTIIDDVKLKLSKLDYSIRKSKRLNENISKISNKIGKEQIRQSELEEDLINIQEQIKKAVNESEMPVMKIDESEKVIYCNKSSWIDINFNKANEIKFIEKRFTNGGECIKLIRNTKLDEYNSMNLYTKEDQVYRFICSCELSGNNIIKTLIFNDITQSTLIQNQLKESEEKYKKLMDLLIDGVIIHDLENIEYINDAALEILNIPKDIKDIRFINIKEKLNDKYLKEFNDSLNLILKGKVNKIINKFKTINNKYIEIITTKMEYNNSFMILSIIVDINETEIALRKLDGSKKTYQALVQNLPDGIIVMDKFKKNIIYQNKSMIRILKSIKIESINKFIDDYISKEFYGQVKKYEIDKAENSSLALTIIDMKEENQFLVLIRLLDNEERVLEAIKELDLVNNQHHVKNEFLINTSKCLKDPIENISKINDKLEKNKHKYNSNHINNYTKLVKRNCYRIQRLINNMKEIADTENGVSSENFVGYDIVKLTKNIVDIIEKNYSNKGINIKFKSNINSYNMIIDVDKMERAILNLISNSIKFSEMGSYIEVNITRENKEIKISVKDEGVGIPKDRMNFIFTKFGQIDRTLSRNTEGCGVGLALVKEIVNLHKGQIHVQSEEGVGSTFTIILQENIGFIDKKTFEREDYKSIEEKINVEFADIYF
ncbi:two-component sensor histidine kinase,sporulation-associated spo0A,Alkaline phosphatase synthesis sensor protein phoR,adaptive-response sensory kinase,Predicted periplasmic ligand-binding sensor domain,phosphate regulon sensor kinase PhoR,Histidine kinase-, DNA gyrase B-, and HSP90-like ATPase [[Clostridium] sordellii]|uniref:PAS domain-containing sensor histidine kinase n=1 Tax=Paraclostridium sordellii TaxID=1505 RepID=UPI0005423630|nr:ATP-binding protein [Paeniclostridium sordellii]CEK32756.1 two-component sensor histidine kinase,sporulation-associated spo0A,Alkaline phosphatase synthesis sensor protein phoR,adaptive-response sensory kinase,Predicted periplasmic ligand-binding sensor domain,phosphate regulon sensor kinase PhoR,Histidine kinase-, DNA gyrase B-, and HSP90-like ATPase [[Clostridium] sordellii] [Paeniclostridium sordellii]